MHYFKGRLHERQAPPRGLNHTRSLPLSGDELRTATDEGGERRYTPLSGLALMVFFVYACQCMSTLAVVRRETGGWKWPLFMFGSMTAIAYVAALIVFQGGKALGFG